MIAVVRTAVISDLHLGTLPGNDLLSAPAMRERLFAALADVDRLVVLGDLAELREAPVGQALAAVYDFADHLNEEFAGRQVVLAAGNHDHQLVAAWLESRRLRPKPLALPVDSCVKAPRTGPLGTIVRRMPDCEVMLAYPGLRLREDVYAMHGHYLDLHMTVPTLETIAVSMLARFEGHDPEELSTPDEYEAVLAPIYALVYSTVQGRPVAARPLASGASVRMWGRMHPEDPDLAARARAVALRRGLIPAATALLNAAGLGPFEGEMTGAALRRAGIAGACRVIERLGIDTPWVVYGHTHRAGPLEGEGEWRAPTGSRLINCGHWTWQPQLASGSEGKGPYWPGGMVRLDDDGPPRLVRVLADVPESEMPQPRG
ncbi:MAG TPA: metallophosphoesterase [Thermoleophilaceae bacterium]|nr:metallophosphoesterase [Thermoleophilaceae bacterium]